MEDYIYSFNYNNETDTGEKIDMNGGSVIDTSLSELEDLFDMTLNLDNGQTITEYHEGSLTQMTIKSLNKSDTKYLFSN